MLLLQPTIAPCVLCSLSLSDKVSPSKSLFKISYYLISFSVNKNFIIMTRNLYSDERKYCSCKSVGLIIWLVPVIQTSDSLPPTFLSACPSMLPPLFQLLFSFSFSVLFQLPHHSFTGSYSVLFKIICCSCQTSLMCPTFCSFHCCPHVGQAAFMCWFFNFLPKNSQAIMTQLQKLEACESPTERIRVGIAWHEK
jgi:hypothetical protein